MSKYNLKKIFFECGAKSLERVIGTDNKIYICPICMQYFYQDSLTNKTLSLEHVPPRSIGGKEITLTCTKCNTTAGHNIDSEADCRYKLYQLGHIISQRTYGEINFYMPVQIQIGNISLNARLDAVNEETKISVVKINNNPENYLLGIKKLVLRYFLWSWCSNP